jgi:hypothetical protein
MSEEVKLGWYRYRGTVHNLYEAVYASRSEVVVRSVDTKWLHIWSAKNLLDNCDYIGPELGEWVEAEDTLMVCELPIRVRVRNSSKDSWIEGKLIAVDSTKMYKYCVDGSLISRTGLGCYGQCQVWRARK